jgi:flagellar biosynthesis protein FliP
MTKKTLFLYFCLFILQTPLCLAKLNVPLMEESSKIQESKNGREVVGSQSFAFPLPKIQLEMQDEMSPRQLSLGLKLLVILTLLTLAPSIMIMMTPFTRIIIVLSFTRRAIGTQSMPSDKMMVSLAIFLTIFQMAPIFNRVQDEALTPFLEKKIEYTEAFKRGMEPFRKYMRRATREEDLKVFVKLAQGKKPKSFDEVSTLTLIPAFIISEFKTGFQFGVVLFLPFLMLDMVIATTLMSMGMMMLPPAMVSTPFKLLLFVLIDGWGLIVNALMKSIIMS